MCCSIVNHLGILKVIIRTKFYLMEEFKRMMAPRFDLFLYVDDIFLQIKNKDVMHALRAKLHETCCYKKWIMHRCVLDASCIIKLLFSVSRKEAQYLLATSVHMTWSPFGCLALSRYSQWEAYNTWQAMCHLVDWQSYHSWKNVLKFHIWNFQIKDGAK